MLPRASVPAECARAVNVDYPGNDLAHDTTSTDAACMALCTGTAGCTHASWAWGTCWMKQGTPAPPATLLGADAVSFDCTAPSTAAATTEPSAINATAMTIDAADARNTRKCTIIRDHDFAGHDIAHYPIYKHSVFGCVAHCDRDARCTHFAFIAKFGRYVHQHIAPPTRC